MLNRLMQDLKEAMKNKDVNKKIVVQLIIDKAQKLAKKDNVAVEDGHVVTSVKSELKQTEEALEIITRHNGTDEQKNECLDRIDMIKTYLPKQLEMSELYAIVEDTGLELNIERTQKNMGVLIKAVKAKCGDSVDGKTLSTVVKLFLDC